MARRPSGRAPPEKMIFFCSSATARVSAVNASLLFCQVRVRRCFSALEPELAAGASLLLSQNWPPVLLCFSYVLASPSKYGAIFQFGDSLSDTGNFLHSGALAFPVIGKLPYGETFFRHPTGRSSDGRLIIDFIAEEFGLPYLPPYLALKGAEKYPQHGVNFAVAGATALGSEFFYQRNVTIMWTNASLSVQLDWFKKFKSSLCTNNQDCENYLKKSLFLVGEIGGNDYNYQAFVGADIKQLTELVPLVIQAITDATTFLIEQGAVKLVVPGNLPVGCSAIYLTLFQSPNKGVYDTRNGCLRALNDFAKYHNNKLKEALQKLREKYPHANIVYGDYYTPAMRFYHAPEHHGFPGGVLRACCGGGGPYNFNYSARCGHTGSTACEHPSTFANWDGIHFTEAAYRWIARSLISDISSAHL